MTEQPNFAATIQFHGTMARLAQLRGDDEMFVHHLRMQTLYIATSPRADYERAFNDPAYVAA